MNQKQVKMEVSGRLQELSREIQTLETQLQTVESKLSGLKKDVLIYGGFFLGPMLVIQGFSFLAEHTYGVPHIVWQMFGSVLSILNFIVQPFFFFHLVKSLFFLYYNREKRDYFYEMPKVRGKYPKPEQVVPEETYVAERHKVWMVLNKYYLYREEMEKKLEACIENDERIPDQELYAFLDGFVFYEQIRTLDPFTGAVARKAKRNTWRVFIAVIAFVIIFIAMIFV
ncbi:MAG: hypothetical protein ACI4FY_04335 [Acetatifactor sp.]